MRSGREDTADNEYTAVNEYIADNEDTADKEDTADNEDTTDNAMDDAWFRREMLAGLAAGMYGYGLACDCDGRCAAIRMVALVVPGGWRCVGGSRLVQRREPNCKRCQRSRDRKYPLGQADTADIADTRRLNSVHVFARP